METIPGGGGASPDLRLRTFCPAPPFPLLSVPCPWCFCLENSMEMGAFLWPRPHIHFDLSHHTCSMKHAALSDTPNCCDSRRLLTPSCDLFCSLSLVFFPHKGLGANK